jgi:hypothetical protein
MSLPRRNLIRPARPGSNNERQTDKLRTALGKERAALSRWMSRLRRAFHSVERIQARRARFERRLAARDQ